MKKLILGMALLVSTAAFASSDAAIFPQVYNFGSHVQVQMYNQTTWNATCSGWLNLTFQSGRRDSLYFQDWVPARQSRFRTIYPRTPDRIMFVNHSIFCR